MRAVGRASEQQGSGCSQGGGALGGLCAEDGRLHFYQAPFGFWNESRLWRQEDQLGVVTP